VTDTDAITGLEGDLRTNGVDVESIERGDRLRLTYTTAYPGDSVDHGEMGRVCNTLLDRAEAGEWEPVPVEATVLRFEGDVQGTWRVDPAWVEGVLDYSLSEEAFSARVLDSLAEAGGDGDGPPRTSGGTDASPDADVDVDVDAGAGPDAGGSA
jgi:hypothetical protein